MTLHPYTIIPCGMTFGYDHFHSNRTHNWSSSFPTPFALRPIIQKLNSYIDALSKGDTPSPSGLRFFVRGASGDLEEVLAQLPSSGSLASLFFAFKLISEEGLHASETSTPVVDSLRISWLQDNVQEALRTRGLYKKLAKQISEREDAIRVKFQLGLMFVSRWSFVMFVLWCDVTQCDVDVDVGVDVCVDVHLCLDGEPNLIITSQKDWVYLSCESTPTHYIMWLQFQRRCLQCFTSFWAVANWAIFQFDVCARCKARAITLHKISDGWLVLQKPDQLLAKQINKMIAPFEFPFQWTLRLGS